MSIEQPADMPAHRDAQTSRVVAVVVTYNREHLIGECLDALAAQTRPLDAIVVVDNASSDASGRIARDHAAGADVLALHRNVGGAGGFAAGIARALEHHEADWVWVMDDDTIPSPGAVQALVSALAGSPVRLSVLSSRAEWTDGREHPMNRPRTRLGATRAERADAAMAAPGARPIRTASYVSALLNAQDVRRLGLPWADYFIWSDDFEHTGRLLRHGRGVHVPGSIVEHRTATFANAQASPGLRFYYDVRNRVWALLRTRSFTATERVVYGGRTVLGWLLMLVRTRDTDLVGIGARALRDALARGPRRSDVVLAADPAAAADVRRIERAAGR